MSDDHVTGAALAEIHNELLAAPAWVEREGIEFPELAVFLVTRAQLTARIQEGTDRQFEEVLRDALGTVFQVGWEAHKRFGGSVEGRGDLAEIATRLTAATPGPWRWSGYVSPDRFALPEIVTTHSGQIRVLAFLGREAVRVVYQDSYEDAGNVTPSQAVIEELGDRAPEQSNGIRINEDGEPDDNGYYYAYMERGTAMAFQDQERCVVRDVGSKEVPVRWDCFRGQTTEEAGREPYRYDVASIVNPDAELLVHAPSDIKALLDEVYRLREIVGAAVPALAAHGKDYSQRALVDACQVTGGDPAEWSEHPDVLARVLAVESEPGDESFVVE